MGMLGAADWAIIAVYFAILGVVVWFAARQQETTTDYFLAGRNVGFFAIGASIFASNIGSEWVLWQTGYPDILSTERALRSAVLPGAIGSLLILIACVIWFRRRR